MFRICVALLILSVVPIPVANAALPGTKFASADHQYIVELSRTPEKKVLISVFHATNETRTLHWGRAIEWKDEEHGFFSANVDGVKALVTNDGNTVVLRDNNTTSEKNGIRIIQKSPANDHLSRPFERRDLTGAEPDEFTSDGGQVQGLSRRPQRGQMRMRTIYMHVSSLLDFILEERNSYALWFGQTDQWLLISLHDFRETIVHDAETLNTLNQSALAMARDRVRQHQPPPLRKIFGSLRKRVADFVPTLAAPTASPLYMSGEVSAAYLFLTARHYRSDQSFIEGLILFKHDGIFHEHGPMRDEIELDLTPSRGERLIGDYLWSRWNGETNREIIPKEQYQLLPYDTYRYLGSIDFKLEFPVDVPSTNSGALWFYLVPADAAAAKWHRSSDLIIFRSSLGRPASMGGRRFSSTLGRDGRATVRGLTPGAYRAKAVWERNPPAGIWRTNVYLGTAGDYESLQTQPITVTAGQTVTNLSIAISNLIAAPVKPP